MALVPSPSLRLFFALWPDESTRAALATLQTMVSGRKTKYENLHLTLAFLGQQPSAIVADLEQVLASLPANEMTLVLDRFGYFKRSKIAWVGMRDIPQQLFDLQRGLMDELARRRTLADTTSSFRPHVTLARDAPAPDERPFEPIRWRVGHACLVSSSTEPGGVLYRVLASKKW